MDDVTQAKEIIAAIKIVKCRNAHEAVAALTILGYVCKLGRKTLQVSQNYATRTFACDKNEIRWVVNTSIRYRWSRRK